MFYVKLSESTAARRRVPILMVDETDGTTPLTGLTLAGLISKNGGTFASVAGSFAEAGYGQYYYQFATAEIDTLGWTGLHVTATGARNYDAIVHVTSYDAYSGGFITAGSVWAEDISGVTTAGTAGSQLNLVAAGGAGITAGDVWQYDISAITTAGTAGSQVNLAASGGAGITAGDVWEYDISAITTAGSAGTQLNSAAAGAGATTGDIATAVWSFDYFGDITGQTLVDAKNYANYANTQTQASAIATAVWEIDVSTTGLATTSIPYPLGYLVQASTGAGITAADVWNYAGTTEIGSVKETLESANTNASNAASNTGASTIRDAVWDTDLSYLNPSTQAAGILYQAAAGTTLNAPSEVWSYVTREITGGLANTVTSVTNPVEVSSSSMSGIANTVWSTDVSAFLTPSAGYDLTQAASATGITAGDVWDYATRTITGGSIDTNNDKTGYSLSASQTFDLTGSITGNLSGSVGSVTNPVDLSTTALSGVASTVWSAATRTITGGTADTVTNPVDVTVLSQASIATEVWNDTVASYTTNGTFGFNVLRSDAANKSGDVTLRSAGGINMVDADVHRIDNDVDAATYLKDALTGVGATWTGNIVGNITGSVNSVTTDVNVSTTSMSGIANTVWATDVSGYTSPSAGYDLSNATAGGGITAGDVWSYATRDITGGTVDTVTNDVNVTTASMSGIANTVWSVDVSGYTSPSAGYDLSNATAGGGITAGDVWQYATRTITGGLADTVTTVTNGVTVTTNNDKTGYSLSASQAFDLTGNITGNLSGSVGSVTNNVPVDEAAISADVWSYATRTLTSGSGITAGDVWSYATRTTTGGVVDTVNDKTGYSLSGTQAFNVTGNITGNVSGSVGSVTNPVDITTNAMSGTAGSVWNYVTRTLTSGAGATAGDVWSYATRTITGGTVDTATTVTNGVTVTTNNDKTGYALSGTQSFNLTGNITGSVSGSVGSVSGAVGSVTSPVSVDTTSMSGIANTVWTNNTRTLTSGAGATAGDVWSYATRTLTSGGSGITAGDVWSYVLSNTDTAEANLVTAASGSGITAGDVWSYGTREITGGIANTVNNVTNGVTVTTNNDKTGYALSTAGVNAVQSGLSTLTQAQVGTEVDSSLSDVGLTTTVTGRIDTTISSRMAESSYVAPPTTAAIANTVWSNASRTITGGAVTSVTNPVDVSTNSMSGIANTVWTNNTRTLTSGAGATAGDVWNYNIASITTSGSAAAQLNDASVSGSVVTVVNGPYRLTSIAEGTDGRIDILADSVQTIQLSCLDGFGAPFNITGYTAAVNVYDVSGALTVTYTPTIDFASNGILSFDIDTDVTGVTGRYTSVVELTAGADVIQLGPIEILVRPL